ncbi:TPA: hypothetical protein ACJI8U_002179 [Morganella morganii]
MDLATLVTEGMKLIGRGDLVPEGSSLDNHSTISLSLGGTAGDPYCGGG